MHSLAGALAYLQLLPVQPDVGVSLHVEGKGDQRITADGGDDADQARPSLQLVSWVAAVVIRKPRRPRAVGQAGVVR
jgi:hypothetical protein